MLEVTPTNDQRIAQALQVLQKCLRAFVEEQMRRQYNDRWLEKCRLSLDDFRATYAGSVNLDVQALIRIATDKQHQVLYNALSPRERNFLHELRDIRNRYAHQKGFEDRDVECALDTLELFLKIIKAPEAEGIGLLRRPAPATAPPTPIATKATTATVSTVAKSALLDIGAEGRQRGVRLFQYLAERANRRQAIGIAYGDFMAFLHQKASFREVAGRNYLPSDSGPAIDLAHEITAANGDRIDVTAGGRTIKSGMDTFIWATTSPFDRPERAWHNPKGELPYSRTDWKAVFPDGMRRLIRPEELAKLA